MRQPPKWTQFYRFSVISGISVLAVVCTIAWWCKVDVSPMFETAMIRRGELWRLCTSILLHGGIVHLVFNLYWFWIFGTSIEQVFGHLRTAILIAILAVGSGALQFALASGGVGLSGVGYGLFGMLWVLSAYDERFRDAIDQRTVKLFIGWFLFCVFTTLVKWFPVGNVAHAGGAVLGALIGIASTRNGKRTLAAGLILVLVGFGLWGSTFGRPKINFSAQAGYEEEKWGDDALETGRNQEAAHWLKDAVVYQPKLAVYWFNLGIAYQRLGHTKEARDAYQRARQLEPTKTEYANAVNACQ